MDEVVNIKARYFNLQMIQSLVIHLISRISFGGKLQFLTKRNIRILSKITQASIRFISQKGVNVNRT